MNICQQESVDSFKYHGYAYSLFSFAPFTLRNSNSEDCVNNDCGDGTWRYFDYKKEFWIMVTIGDVHVFSCDLIMYLNKWGRVLF